MLVVSCKTETTDIACVDLVNPDQNKIFIGTVGVDCNVVHFDIELALNRAQQSQGLMNRTNMAEDAGMLFVFPDEAERGFWMKNTLIPLDMIFIKANGVIHHIHENAVPHDLTSIKSNGPVMAVLEINGGLSQKLNIKVGDSVNHPFFNRQNTQ